MTTQIGDVDLLVKPKLDPRENRRAGEDAADDIGEGLNSRSDRLGRGFSTGLVAGIGVGLASGLPQMIGGFASDLFGLAGSMEEVERKAATVFGDELPRARAELEQLAPALGLSANEALRNASAIQDILVPMGFARDEATDLTTRLFGLGGALAANSGGTRTAEEAHLALTAALTGEREQLKGYGVVISEADVQQRILALGLDTTTSEAEKQAKAIATLDLITSQSLDAQRLFAEGADTQARKQAEARAAFQESKEELAQALAPAFLEVTELAGGFASVLSSTVGFLVENKTEVLALVGAYSAYQGARAIGGAIDATKAFTSAHGSLRAGLANSLRSINPWGVAAAGAVAVATIAITKWREEQAKARARIEETSNALRDQHDTLTLVAEGWEAFALESSEFADNNQIDDLDRMGISVQELNELLRDGTDGLRSYVEAAVETGEVTLENGATIDEVVSRWAELEIAQGGVYDGLRLLVSGNSDVLDSFEIVQEDLAAAIAIELEKIAVDERHSEAIRDSAAALLEQDLSATELVQRYERDLVPAMTDAANEADDLTDAEEDLTSATEDATEAHVDQRTELEKVTGRFEGLASVVDEARKAIERLNGGQIELDDATLSLEGAVDDLTSALDENGRTFDIDTEKGRANMEQARDTAGAIRDYELALIQSGTSAQAAGLLADEYRQRLADQLSTAGLTKAEIDDLIETYGNVPDEVATAIEVDSLAALTDTSEITRRLNEINGLQANASVNITRTGDTIPVPSSGGTVRFFSHGGVADSPSVFGEAGPELALPLTRPDRAQRLLDEHFPGNGNGVSIENINITLGAGSSATEEEARRLAIMLRDQLLLLEAETA